MSTTASLHRPRENPSSPPAQPLASLPSMIPRQTAPALSSPPKDASSPTTPKNIDTSTATSTQPSKGSPQRASSPTGFHNAWRPVSLTQNNGIYTHTSPTIGRVLLNRLHPSHKMSNSPYTNQPNVKDNSPPALFTRPTSQSHSSSSEKRLDQGLPQHEIHHLEQELSEERRKACNAESELNMYRTYINKVLKLCVDRKLITDPNVSPSATSQSPSFKKFHFNDLSNIKVLEKIYEDLRLNRNDTFLAMKSDMAAPSERVNYDSNPQDTNQARIEELHFNENSGAGVVPDHMSSQMKNQKMDELQDKVEILEKQIQDRDREIRELHYEIERSKNSDSPSKSNLGRFSRTTDHTSTNERIIKKISSTASLLEQTEQMMNEMNRELSRSKLSKQKLNLSSYSLALETKREVIGDLVDILDRTLDLKINRDVSDVSSIETVLEEWKKELDIYLSELLAELDELKARAVDQSSQSPTSFASFEKLQSLCSDFDIPVLIASNEVEAIRHHIQSQRDDNFALRRKVEKLEFQLSNAKNMQASPLKTQQTISTPESELLYKLKLNIINIAEANAVKPDWIDHTETDYDKLSESIIKKCRQNRQNADMLIEGRDLKFKSDNELTGSEATRHDLPKILNDLAINAGLDFVEVRKSSLDNKKRMILDKLNCLKMDVDRWKEKALDMQLENKQLTEKQIEFDILQENYKTAVDKLCRLQSEYEGTASSLINLLDELGVVHTPDPSDINDNIQSAVAAITSHCSKLRSQIDGHTSLLNKLLKEHLNVQDHDTVAVSGESEVPLDTDVRTVNQKPSDANNPREMRGDGDNFTRTLQKIRNTYEILLANAQESVSRYQNDLNSKSNEVADLKRSMAKLTKTNAEMEQTINSLNFTVSELNSSIASTSITQESHEKLKSNQADLAHANLESLKLEHSELTMKYLALERTANDSAEKLEVLQDRCDDAIALFEKQLNHWQIQCERFTSTSLRFLASRSSFQSPQKTQLDTSSVPKSPSILASDPSVLLSDGVRLTNDFTTLRQKLNSVRYEAFECTTALKRLLRQTKPNALLEMNEAGSRDDIAALNEQQSIAVHKKIEEMTRVTKDCEELLEMANEYQERCLNMENRVVKSMEERNEIELELSKVRAENESLIEHSTSTDREKDRLIVDLKSKLEAAEKRFSECQATFEESQEELKRSTDIKIKELYSQITLLEQEIQEKNGDVSRYEDDLMRMRTEIDKLEEYHRELESAKISLAAKLENQSAIEKELRHSLEMSRIQTDKYSEDLTEARREVETVKSQLEKEKDNCEKRVGDSAKLEEKIKVLESEIESLSLQLAKTENSSTSREHEILATQTELRAQLDNVTASNFKLQKELKTLTELHSAAKNEAQETSKSKETLSRYLDEANKRENDLKAKLKESEAQRLKLDAQLLETQTRTNELKQIARKKEEELFATKSLLEACQKDLKEMTSKYDRVYGEKSQLVIIRTDLEQQLNNTRFELQRTTQQSQHKDKELSTLRQQYQACRDELSQVKANYQAVSSAKNKLEAIKKEQEQQLDGLNKNYETSQQTLATARKDLEMAIGKLAKSDDKCKSLQVKLSDADDRLKHAELELTSCKSELDQLKQQHESTHLSAQYLKHDKNDLQHKMHEMQSKIDQLQKELREQIMKHKNDIEAHKGKLKEAHSQITQSETTLLETRKELAIKLQESKLVASDYKKLQLKYSEVVQKTQQLEEKLNQSQPALSQLQQKLDKKQNECKGLKKETTKYKELYENMASSLTTIEKERNETASKNSKLEKDITNSVEKIKDLKQRCLNYEDAMAKLNQRVQDLDEEKANLSRLLERHKEEFIHRRNKDVEEFQLLKSSYESVEKEKRQLEDRIRDLERKEANLISDLEKMKEQLIKTSVESKITLEQRQKEIESLNLERSLVSSQMTQLKDETASALDLKQTVARLQAQIDKLTAERQSVSRLLENALRHASKPEISALLKNVPTSDAQSDIIHSSTILYQLLCFYEIRNQELQARILSAEEHGVNGLRRSEIGENNEASRNEGSVMLSRLKSQYSELQLEHRRFFTEIKAMIQSLAKSNSFKLVVDLDKLQSTRDILDTLDYIFLKLCPPSRSFRHSCNAVVPDDVLPADANLLVISTQLLVSLEVAQATAKTAVSNSFLDEETNSGIQLQISTLRSSDSNQAIKVTNIIGGIKFLEIFITQFYQQFHSRHMKSIKNVAQKATKKHKLLISDLHKVQEDLSKANAELTRLRAWETESTEKLARLSILVEKGESYRRNAMERKNLGSSKQELRY